VALLTTVAVIEYAVAPAIAARRGELLVVHAVSWPLLVVGLVLTTAASASRVCQTQALLAPGPTLGFGTQWRIDLAGRAIGQALPHGRGTAAQVRARLMSERGISRIGAEALVGVQLSWSVVGLLALWAVALVMALPRSGLTMTAVLLLASSAAAVTVREVSRARAARPRGAPARGPLADVVPRRWRTRAEWSVRRNLQALRQVGTVGDGLLWSMVAWLFDAVCLWTCLVAFGAPVPVELVIAAYGVAGLVGLLPLTPGGIGVVEVLLVPMLAAAGAGAGPALLGVLTWRLLQYWLVLPVAAACWASLGERPHSAHTS
jgi:uncharacterized membrane protein YbhN (UPF0104 family)